MRNTTIILVAAAAMALAGCTRSTNALRVNTQPPPQPLPSSPSGDIQSSQLEQVQPGGDPNAPFDPNSPQAPTVLNQPGQQPTETASLDPNNAQPISHEAMTGAWNVNSDNADCRVFLSFTQWSGGYRAGTRRCNAPELASVSAWDIKDNRVVLVDSNGSQVATLTTAGSERYAGTLSSGNPITFSR